MTGAMNIVDAMQTRMWEAWRNEERPGDNLFSSTAMRTVADRIRREQYVRREQQKKIIESELYNIKEKMPYEQTPSARTLLGESCKKCSVRGHEDIFQDNVQRRRNVNNCLEIKKSEISPSLQLWSNWFSVLARIRSQQRFTYPQMAPKVVPDERMQDAIHQAARESLAEKKRANEAFDEESYYEQMVQKHTKRAAKLLVELQSKISDRFLQFACWLVYKLTPMFLSGVTVHPAHIDMLKAASKRADDCPIIYLPLHRSHLDYILVSFILMNNDLRAPIVAAGNNLNMPIFGTWLRHAGAFFIKRRLDPVGGKKDVVYRALLHTYMQKCLSVGHNIEFFIEGGRSRTGKPVMPKSGILSVIIDACMDGTIKDALLVPVSVNYEKLVDGNFVTEQLGQKKIPESFLNAAKSIWNTLNSQYGLMRIDFNEPISLRELVKAFNAKMQENPTGKQLLQHTISTSSLYGTDVVKEEHRALVENIARHVVYDCANAASVMSTNALAFLLLTQFRDGATMAILVEALNRLREQLQDKRELGFTGTSEDVIRYAANLLGPNLIEMGMKDVQTFIKPITAIPNVIELYYYANGVTPFFALDAVIVTAATYLRKISDQTGDDVGIVESELIKLTQEFCDMFRYEFIFVKPCQGAESVLDEAITSLCNREILRLPVVEVTEDEQNARRLDNYLRTCGVDEDDYSDDEEIDRKRELLNEQTKPKLFLPHETHCDRLILMETLAPLTHTYSAVAASLAHLIGCNSIVESEFIKICVKELTDRVTRGACKYGESISTDTIRNCIKVLEKWNVVDISSRTGARLISLNQVYDSARGIKVTMDKINKFVTI